MNILDKRKIERLFAADCAERALLRERAAGREPDPRSWGAVEVARLFAMGEVTWRGLAAADAAALAAADAAALAAAKDAASDAERAEQARVLRELLEGRGG